MNKCENDRDIYLAWPPLPACLPEFFFLSSSSLCIFSSSIFFGLFFLSALSFCFSSAQATASINALFSFSSGSDNFTCLLMAGTGSDNKPCLLTGAGGVLAVIAGAGETVLVVKETGILLSDGLVAGVGIVKDKVVLVLLVCGKGVSCWGGGGE